VRLHLPGHLGESGGVLGGREVPTLIWLRINFNIFLFFFFHLLLFFSPFLKG
jgi:hypothetical protein